MDIDGYDGSELAPLNTNDSSDSGALDNSLTANVNQMFDITSVERNDDENNMGNQLQDNSTERYVENMDNQDQDKMIENMNTQVATQDKKVEESNKGFIKSLGGIIIFVVIWVILGLIAFITSIICFGFSGSTTEKILGLIISLLFGPFYFIYFYLNKNYCGKKSNTEKSD